MEKMAEGIVEEAIAEDLPKLMTDAKPRNQKAQRIPMKKNAK